MCTRYLLFAALSVAAWMPVQTAMADLPNSRTESYLFHAELDNPSSAVIRSVDLHLVPQSRLNDAVAWLVDSIVVTEFDSNNQPTRAWSKSNPSVDTLTGLWTVAHTDYMHPVSAEFSIPPAIIDTLDVDFGVPFPSSAQPTSQSAK